MSCCGGWSNRSYATSVQAAPTKDAAPPAVKAGWSLHPKAVVVVLGCHHGGMRSFPHIPPCLNLVPRAGRPVWLGSFRCIPAHSLKAGRPPLGRPRRSTGQATLAFGVGQLGGWLESLCLPSQHSGYVPPLLGYSLVALGSRQWFLALASPRSPAWVWRRSKRSTLPG